MRPPRGNNNDRGRGRGRGSSPVNGRHIPSQGRGSSSPRGRGRPPYRNLDELDFELQTYNNAPRGSSPFETGGRGSYDAFVGRSRGKFRKPGFLRNEKTPLAKMLDFDRPFLKPIKFVPAQFTPILFQQEEEILQAPETNLADENHAPTAEKVNQIFSSLRQELPDFSETSFIDKEDEGEIATVEFESLAEFVARNLIVENSSQQSASESATKFAKAANPGIEGSVVPKNPTNLRDSKPLIAESEFSVTKIDPQESSDNPVVVVNINRSQIKISEETLSDDEEIIVYSPPNPTRPLEDIASTENPIAEVDEAESSTNNDTSSITNDVNIGIHNVESPMDSSIISPHPDRVETSPSFDSFSFSFTTLPVPGSRKGQLTQGPSPRSRRLTKKDRRIVFQNTKRGRAFASFGVMMEETYLHEVEEPDLRRSERRRGDSDLDWGDSDQINESIDEISSGIAGMDVDTDVDTEAFKAFGKRMDVEQTHTTIDDLADIEKHREEDEDEEDSSSEINDDDEDEEDDVVAAEERLLIGNDEDPNTSLIISDDSEDETEEESSDETPKKAFMNKLMQMRGKAKGKEKEKATVRDSDSSDEDISENDDTLARDFTWAEEDDDFIAMIEEFISGQSDDNLEFPVATKRGKNKAVTPDLWEQWEKDRTKKAENKRKRAQARLEAAANPFIPHKTGKKGRKAMLKGLEFSEKSQSKQNIPDMAALEVQMRTFISNIGGQTTMALPHMDKFVRKKVHEMALAFNLKSKSAGRGNNRYTTLIKTSRSGIAIDEQKIRRIVNRMGGNRITATRANQSKAGAMPRHRDGDEVGKAAPKIDSRNIGFQMLSAMGWSDGDRIGTSGGLDVPLTAIIKNTKLGLGATYTN